MGRTWMQEARERGIQFKDLTLWQQDKARRAYQEGTGDKDISERGWEGYGYHPDTLEVMGDDPLSTAEWRLA